ncbi:MAG TPA: LemA family protein [Acidimicrobiales bacterium]|jgi:LemA protein|nr:LemA family protein [Acidimicrobiales bacterium]
MAIVIVIVVLVVLLALGLWAAFNGLVRRRNRTQEAWSEIDVELKRRHDLIPNLVSTVEGYASHERGTFEAVTQARAAAVAAGQTGDPTKVAAAENALSGTLRSLFAVAENYPQLRAVESFVQLQETLTATEDKIEYARRYYNTSARDYNTALQSFPRNLIAGMFHFTAVAFYEADATDRAVPTVSFPGSDAASATSGPPPASGSAGPPPASGTGGPPPQST